MQLCTHERGNQRITFTATMILAVAVLFILVNLSIALSGKSIFGMQDWLGFITAMNHLQLAMTFIKYAMARPATTLSALPTLAFPLSN